LIFSQLAPKNCTLIAFPLAVSLRPTYARANPKTEPVVLMITHLLSSAGFVTILSR
jgi:hypothetical protein